VVAVALVVVWMASRSVVTSTGDALDANLSHAARYGLFQVMSYRTNTGFATADVNPWGTLPHIILVLFMFTGASAGSTAGGVKLIRCIIAVKLLAAAVEKAFRPNVVRPIRIGRHVLDQERGHEAVVYILLYLMVWFGGAMAVLLIEPQGTMDLTTSLTASAACLSNTGPGLGGVGTVQHFGWMTDWSKIILAIVMLLGRLEMYAILVLFVPRFWKSE
jgi:trk system potassium uptake protein TrkH